MKKIVSAFMMPFILGAFFMLTAAKDSDKEIERIQKATTVLKDFDKMKESIPSQLLKQSEGIVIVPNLINAGFVVGGKRGKGLAMVKLPSGEWSNPVFVTLTGGSVGFQIGVQGVDLVLLFKHKEALTKAKNGDFTIGGDLSAAAGPVGRSTSANTDYKLEAEVYSYSRSKGLFAGISLNGSNLAFDKTANINFYGEGIDTQSLFDSSGHTSTDIAALRNTLAAMQK